MIPVGIRPPRDAFCVIDHLHRSLDVARDVCAGRFTNCGASLTVDPPDWRNVAVHPDREWWIEWSKFYFGLDLAFAFSVTGDAAFPRAWQSLVSSWIAQVPVEFGPTDALARRLQNWIYAWSRFDRSPGFGGFDVAFVQQLVETISTHAAYLQGHLTPERNHRTLELYALLTAALALPEIDSDGSLSDFAWRGLHQNLLADCRPDGVHREHSTHYHMIALRSWLGARENAARFGLSVPATYDERLHRAVDFAMHCHRPDGSIPAVSDSDTADYRQTLALAATLLVRADLAFVATNGHQGTAPALSCPGFHDGGYYIQRSAWDGLAKRTVPRRHLIFDCGPIGDGGHGHYDLLSIDAWAERPLVVDPGRYTYAEGTPNWRQWFKGTSAHNTVCVDGLDQTVYRCGKPKSPVATGRLLTHLDAPGLNVVGGEALSARYDAVHRRHVFFVAQDYWVVVDALEADTPHVYDLRFNLGAEAWRRTTVEGARVTAPALELLFDGPGALGIEDGWVSPQYGVRVPAPIMTFRTTRRSAARFVTVLLPRDVNRDARVDLMTETIGTSELHITLIGPAPAHVDRLVFAPGGTAFSAGRTHGMATMTWTRTTASGAVTGFVAGGDRTSVGCRERASAPWIALSPDKGLEVER